jgi:hypothetical protein
VDADLHGQPVQLAKLFSALYIAEVLMHGVTRKNGRGLPPSIIQWEEKNAKVS